jgi:hypothetical protein
MTMIEIARFADVYEAEIAASRLRADGYDPVLGGAEHVKTNPLVLQALGGVNMSVPNDQAATARTLLERLRGGAERIEDADPVPAAPARKAGVAALLGALGMGFLLGA